MHLLARPAKGTPTWNGVGLLEALTRYRTQLLAPLSLCINRIICYVNNLLICQHNLHFEKLLQSGLLMYFLKLTYLCSRYV